ncbi:hypothetical protein E2C01_089170 [Portunus trituberculatus]|uniref:Uncharacterized protein n=1 Tax=Portunus trituberculatus TaxID=210409 RepID=A0A5B7JGI7_PORTR|nr:hypothetical protein [Portunus trituberculatus]
MQRVLSAVSSTQPRGTRVRLAVLLFFHFIIFVQGWSFDNPHVPVSFCQTPRDCAGEEWTDPLPTCENFRCVCPSGTCVVYTNGKSDYLFFCGSCGKV